MKQFKMLKIIIDFYYGAQKIINLGVPIFRITQIPLISDIMRMKSEIPNDKIELLDELHLRVKASLSALEESLK